MKISSIYKKTLLFSSVVLLFSSCSDVLNTVPITDEYTTAQDNPNTQLLKNVADADLAMKSVNAIFGDEYWQFDYFFLGDAGSDVAYAGGDGDDFFQIEEYRLISTDYVVGRDWGHINEYIKRCNLIINYVEGVPDLQQARKDEMIGEASLFRALSRFQGVQIWGDFPIVNTTITSINNSNFDIVYPSLYPERKPIAEVYASIIADCEVALAKAPASTAAASSKFTASKNAANALLAKVYATMPNPDWNKVKIYCDAVIEGGYTLLPKFDFLFDSMHEGNAESIWEANGDGVGITINGWCTNVFIGQNWKKFNTPSHKLNNAFTFNLDNKRKATTIKKEATTFADPYWTSYAQFPYPNKMRKTDGTQNFYIFRLADILLLKAEALAHTNDLTGAMALVNQIRARVLLSNVAPATSQDDAINKILNERFLELAFEGHRWFDLKREGKSIEILSKQTYTKGGVEIPLSYAGSISQNDLLWPIPQSIIDNNVNLKQNPGY
jgi:hypothetical protein